MEFYCVDNLLVILLPALAQTLADREISTAISIDVRNIPELPEIFEQAMRSLPKLFPQLLFLDADRNTIISRYSDTRRFHPLSSKLSIESAIEQENNLLEPLCSRANHYISINYTMMYLIAVINFQPPTVSVVKY